jgi:hypothetical protein
VGKGKGGGWGTGEEVGGGGAKGKEGGGRGGPRREEGGFWWIELHTQNFFHAINNY